jgi:hypothetical protein
MTAAVLTALAAPAFAAGSSDTPADKCMDQGITKIFEVVAAHSGMTVTLRQDILGPMIQQCEQATGAKVSPRYSGMTEMKISNSR